MIDLQEPVWEQQPGENDLWHARFLVYLGMGVTRSIRGAYRVAYQKGIAKKGQTATNEGTLTPDELKTLKVPDVWHINAKKHQWIARASAWEREQRRIAIEQEQKERAEMNKRHSSAARILQQAALAGLVDSDKKAKPITDPKIALTALTQGVAIERQARGVPKEIIQIESLSDDQLVARYTELLARLGGAGIGDEESWDQTADSTEPEE